MPILRRMSGRIDINSNRDKDLSSISRLTSILHDLNGDGIPELLIRWTTLCGMKHGVQLFRYQCGAYVASRVSTRRFELNEARETPFLLSGHQATDSELLARDSTGRILTLGSGGAGGFGSWANIIHLDNYGVRLEPMFEIRVDFSMEVSEPRLYLNESITEERESLPEIGSGDPLFFPLEWHQGEGDITPMPIPIMPDVTVAPFPRMYNLEHRLTERITAQLVAEGRIISQ